jgi:beta-galactosidase
MAHPNVIGDFTWTGWDYLGEAGIGRVEYGDERPSLGMAAFQGEFPWLAACCGDLDITGHRRPQSYYREIVFGLRRDPFIAVLRPEHHARAVVHSSPWAWGDVVSSWSWSGQEGKPLTVEVYADADEVELQLNGRSLGRQPATEKHRFRAEFETEYEPGELVAIAWRGGEEVGRMVLESATSEVQLATSADRTEIRAGSSDLAYIELMLLDENGRLHIAHDRPIRIDVDGPGVLQGVASANPINEENFTADRCTTYDGRAVAVVRPTDEGTITVTATAEGCESRSVQIQARR